MAKDEKDPREPDTTAVDEKLDKQDKASDGPVVVQAADVNTLNPEPGPDTGEKQVQARVDKETEAGLRGIEVDPTPNENYTVAGNDLPTPESDPDTREAARNARRVEGPAPL